MRRRTLLAGLVTVGGGAAVGTGAFSTVQSERSVSIAVADDSAALLGIDVNDRYGGQTSSGVEQFNLQENLFESTGFNPEGTTVLYGALAVTNNSGIEGEPISVQFSYESDSVAVPTEQSVPDSTHDGEFSFRAFDPGTAPASPFEGLSYSGEQADVADPGAIPAGETAVFDLVVDPAGNLDPDTYSVDVTLVADIGDGGGGGGGGSDGGTPEGTAIYNWNNLHKIREDLDSDYYLAKDLDEDSGAYNSRVDNPEGNWEPIVDFSGTFDGNGHTIRDLVVERPAESGVGLFGRAGGEITNVGVEDADVTGNQNVGVLVGRQWGGTVERAYATGSVSGGSAYTGGLVGNNGKDATIEESYAAVEVTAGREGTDPRGGTDEEVTFGEYVGGLAGVIQGTLRNSYATGDVTSDGNEYDDDGVGGLVGLVSPDGTVELSYATGDVDAPDIDKGAGRLVGINKKHIRNSYADSTSTVDGPNVDEGTDNLVGRNVGAGSASPDVDAESQTLSTSEMQGSNVPSEMSALEFTSVWGTVTSPAGYPVLQALDKQTQIDVR